MRVSGAAGVCGGLGREVEGRRDVGMELGGDGRERVCFAGAAIGAAGA